MFQNVYNILVMKGIVAKVHDLLIKKKKTLAVAESCTGGLASNILTQISGSSRYFILGMVVYHNKVKEKVLKIPSSMIAKKGAVSEEVARRMAEAVRKIAGTDFGIGITGIAGPTAGSAEKPVGTVFIAINSRDKKISKKFWFSGNRLTIRKKTALKSLELLKRMF
jgi:nicotinamide-nucleotide amidase